MCGISGFADLSRQTGADELKETVKRMATTLHHRGPDDSGVWADAQTGLALAHTRLSIVDLSPMGHQPMLSADERYVITYNGEIYNFKNLSRELENLGHKFRGHSDTEVALAAISQWGPEAAVKRFIGMFAFALWDRKEHTLYLFRDRIGKKPLYYGRFENIFMFGSELKSLTAHPKFDKNLNRDALTLFLRHNCIPGTHSIYKNVYKLAPGHFLAFNLHEDSEPKPIAYWSAHEAMTTGVSNPFTGSDDEAIDRLDILLKDAVKTRMEADVPLGAFLSGGIDSSLVVALMQAQSDRPVKTFSIGFHEEEYNEAQHAKKVAQHLGTEHTELYIKPEEALAVIPNLPQLYDEPFADVSQIPTYLVSKLAKQHVTVSLSGDGGDELFAGYNRYFWGRSIWKSIGWAPVWLRSVAANTMTTLSPQTWETIYKTVGGILPKKMKQPYPGDKIHKMAEILTAKNSEELYLRLISHWKHPEDLVLNGSEPATALSAPIASFGNAVSDFTMRMMYLDMVTYLPDDILVKVDRASMGVSLEARTPLLDHRVVEFSWRIPLSMKIRNGQGKWILRQVLNRYVPKSLIERPKMGFGVPVDSWLRGPLREWAEELLDERRLQGEGVFDPAPIRIKWEEHLTGKRNWQYYLWDILMFQAWHEKEGIC